MSSMLNLIFLRFTRLNLRGRIIRQNATKTHNTSYVLEIMKPVYRSCILQTGTRMKKRMHQVMDNHMQNGDIFSDIRDLVEKEAHLCFVRMTDEIKKYVMNMCTDISRRLDDVIRGYEILKLGGNPPELERITKIMREAAKSSREKLDDLLSELRREEEGKEEPMR